MSGAEEAPAPEIAETSTPDIAEDIPDSTPANTDPTPASIETAPAPPPDDNASVNPAPSESAPTALSPAPPEGEKKAMALGVLSKLGGGGFGAKKSLWKVTEAKVVEAYIRPDEEETEVEAAKPAPKFQLKPFGGCRVGLMKESQKLNYIPVPRDPHRTNFMARLAWIGDTIMQESKLFNSQAMSWIRKHSFPGHQKTTDDLKAELLSALKAAGLGGYKLSKHDLDQIVLETGFGVDTVHVPYVIHDELIMYTEECHERRKTVKKDRDVKAVIRSFLNLTKPLKTSEAKYVRLHLAINKSICKDFCQEKAEATLVEEFAELTRKTNKVLSQRLLADSIFEVADVWTMSTQSGIYARFLSTVLRNISFRSFGETLRLKDLKNVSYLDEFCDALRRPQEFGDDDSTDEETSVYQELSEDDEPDQIVFPSTKLSDNPSNPRIKRMLRRARIANSKKAFRNTIAHRERQTKLLQRISVTTLKEEEQQQASEVRKKTGKPRPLPACAAVPPLGRLRTPQYKHPHLEGDAKWYGDGRLQYTFGRACIKQFREGSITDRVGATKFAYGMHTVPMPPSKKSPNNQQRRTLRFPRKTRGKQYEPLPSLSVPPSEFRSPQSPQTCRTHKEEFEKCGSFALSAKFS